MFKLVNIVFISLIIWLSQGMMCLSESRSDLGLKGSRTKSDVLKKLDRIHGESWRNTFARRAIPFPPHEILILGLKAEKSLEIWVRHREKYVFLKEIPILAASGSSGPKLKQGDYQVPEGFYKVNFFNFNSSYHLSMKINYPNKEDRRIARKEKRWRLGGDIFIHGSNVSAGCIAIGDFQIESLFLISRLSNKVQVVISPRDFRFSKLSPSELKGKNAQLYRRLAEFSRRRLKSN